MVVEDLKFQVVLLAITVTIAICILFSLAEKHEVRLKAIEKQIHIKESQ